MPSSLLSLDDLLEELTAITARAKEIEARRQELLDVLDQLVEDGEADDKLSWNDYTITRAVRTTWQYRPDFEAQRKTLKDELKQLEEMEQALGYAEAVTKTFWTVRQPRT